MKRRTVLAEIPGPSRNHQLIVCLADEGQQWTIELREQRWAEGIGWYDQKVIALEPAQWRSLRQLLNSSSPALDPDPIEAPATVPFRLAPAAPPPRSVADGA